jgi:predicted methyltransferase
MAIIGVGNTPGALAMTFVQFAALYPQQAKDFMEYLADNGETEIPSNHAFYLDHPSVTNHVYKAGKNDIFEVDGKKRVLTYADDSVALAWRSYKGQGFWDSLD